MAFNVAGFKGYGFTVGRTMVMGTAKQPAAPVKVDSFSLDGKKHSFEVDCLTLKGFTVKGLTSIPKETSENILVKTSFLARWRLGLSRKSGLFQTWHPLSTTLKRVNGYQRKNNILFTTKEIDSREESLIGLHMYTEVLLGAPLAVVSGLLGSFGFSEPDGFGLGCVACSFAGIGMIMTLHGLTKHSIAKPARNFYNFLLLLNKKDFIEFGRIHSQIGGQ